MVSNVGRITHRESDLRLSSPLSLSEEREPTSPWLLPVPARLPLMEVPDMLLSLPDCRLAPPRSSLPDCMRLAAMAPLP